MIINKISLMKIVILLIISTNSLAFKPMSGNPNSDYNNFIFRASNNVLLEKDFDYIERKISIFFDKNYQEESDIGEIINIGRFAVKYNQLSNKLLKMLTLFSVAVMNFPEKHNREYLNDILWWCKLREINDNNKLTSFIEDQMLTRRRGEILSFYYDNGMIEDLTIIQKKFKFENSEKIYKLATRKAKLMNLLKNDNEANPYLILHELKQSIEEYLLFKNRNNILYSEHLLWVIKKFGVYRQKKIISQILHKLKSDPYYYNKSDVYGVNKEQQQLYKDVMEERIEFHMRIELAINPYQNIKKFYIQ